MVGFLAAAFIALMLAGLYVIADRIGDEESASMKRKKLEEKAALRSLKRTASLVWAPAPTFAQLATRKLEEKKARHAAESAAWQQAFSALLATSKHPDSLLPSPDDTMVERAYARGNDGEIVLEVRSLISRDGRRYSVISPRKPVEHILTHGSYIACRRTYGGTAAGCLSGWSPAISVGGYLPVPATTPGAADPQPAAG